MARTKFVTGATLLQLVFRVLGGKKSKKNRNKPLCLTLLALFLKQKLVRKCTWLDPIQCEKNTRTIFNRVRFSLKTRVHFYVIRQQM